MQMTGTKFGCGAGLCGACTVHVNGEAVRSCQTSLSDVVGKKITTIEGLSAKGDHPLQKAWIAEQVPQCGYCQSGKGANAGGAQRLRNTLLAAMGMAGYGTKQLPKGEGMGVACVSSQEGRPPAGLHAWPTLLLRRRARSRSRN
jgi:[2Fe-2S] binding domain